MFVVADASHVAHSVHIVLVGVVLLYPVFVLLSVLGVDVERAVTVPEANAV